MKIVLRNSCKVIGIVVGDGEDMESMIHLTEQLEISDRIRFLGYKDNINEIISQIDFVVLPSRWEGLPLTPIEVFSLGKTIIASNIAGNSEIVKNNWNGLVFKSEDYTELANRINFLIDSNNKEILDSLELNAAKTFSEKYDYQIFQNRYRNIYRSI